MRIYVDFDDCLCETARNCSGLVADLFGKDVPYENISFFNLQKSFFLTDDQYEYMMLEDYYKLHFDYAVEDSPSAFRFFDHLPELKVMVYERPWNREAKLPGAGYVRCPDWAAIREMVGSI